MFEISFAFSVCYTSQTMEEASLLLERLSTKLTVFLPLTNSDSWKDI